MKAISPDEVSDSTFIDVPAPTSSCFGVLNILLNGEVESEESAVANPDTPVKFAPSPTN